MKKQKRELLHKRQLVAKTMLDAFNKHKSIANAIIKAGVLLHFLNINKPDKDDTVKSEISKIGKICLRKNDKKSLESAIKKVFGFTDEDIENLQNKDHTHIQILKSLKNIYDREMLEIKNKDEFAITVERAEMFAGNPRVVKDLCAYINLVASKFEKAPSEYSKMEKLDIFDSAEKELRLLEYPESFGAKTIHAIKNAFIRQKT